LARLHDRLGHREQAIEHYRRSISFEDQRTGGHTYAHVDFLILILRHAPQLVDDVRQTLARRSKQMDRGTYAERFILRAARATLRYQEGDKAKAGIDAAWALNAAARRHSGLDRHPGLGLVMGMDDLVERMRAIANETLGTSDFAPP
jgi:hypothetical protein